MATEAMLDRACKTDEDLRKIGVRPSQLNAPHAIGEVEEEVDPFEQARAARWLRRERPAEWRLIADVLGLEPGKPLTRWPAAPADAVVAAVCLGEAHADRIIVETAQVAAQHVPETGVDTVQTPSRPTLRPRRPDWAWSDDALCRGEDLVLFFGPDGERPPQKDIREQKAKAICAQCPVRNECLSYALDRPEKYGLYGGLNEDERVSVRRRLQRTGVLSTVARPGPRVTVTEKQCCRCQELLSADVFYADHRATDGLTSACKGCQHAGERQGRRDAQEAAAS